MPETLFMLIHTPNAKRELSKRLMPHFQSVNIYEDYSRARRWLEYNFKECPPDLSIVEWDTDIDVASMICRLILDSTPTTSQLVVICQTPKLLEGEFSRSVRFLRTDRIPDVDLLSWLGLTGTNHYIHCGQLILWPALREVFNGQGVISKTEPYNLWPIVKLSSSLRTRVLEYLMINARGPENSHKASDVLEAVWFGHERGAYTPKSAHDAISGIRKQIEIDPDNPSVILSRNGRGNSGYYISIEPCLDQWIIDELCTYKLQKDTYREG